MPVLTLIYTRVAAVGVFSTSRVHFVATPAMTPKAASQGARASVATAPAAPQVTGTERIVFPASFLTTILFTLASFDISLNFSTNFSGETWNTSFLSPTWAPHDEQNLELAASSTPHSTHFTMVIDQQ